MSKHKCPNQLHSEGANGGCYVEAYRDHETPEGFVYLDVGWSCAVVHRGLVPVTWISELIAIATGHEGGVAGFLKAQNYSGESYALMCDPPSIVEKTKEKSA